MLAETLANPAAKLLWRNADSGEPLAYLLGLQGPDSVDLLRVAVLPAARRRGLAASLIEELRAVTRCPVLLEVSEINREAVLLYRKCGFREISRRRAYYADGSDCIVMQG